MRTFKSTDDEKHLYFMIDELEGEDVFSEVEKKLYEEQDITLRDKERTIYEIVLKGIWEKQEFELSFDMDFGNTSIYSESIECLNHLEKILNDE